MSFSIISYSTSRVLFLGIIATFQVSSWFFILSVLRRIVSEIRLLSKFRSTAFLLIFADITIANLVVGTSFVSG